MGGATATHGHGCLGGVDGEREEVCAGAAN